MFWDPVFDQIAEVAGAPPSQIKLVSTLLLSYPLASLYTRLPRSSPNIAHVYSLAISIFFLVPLLGLGVGLLHLLFSCFGTYFIVITLRGSEMPWVAFFFVMSHLMYNHLVNFFQGVPASEIEITFTQMVLVMNLSTFAWNVHDGRRKPDELDASQLATRLTHVPNPLAFLGYCFFFPAMLIGPSLDYSTYDSLIKHTIFTTPPPGTSDNQAKATKRRIPYGRKRVAYLHLAIGLFFLGLYSLYGAKGSYTRIVEPEFTKWSRLERFAFLQFAGFMARTKYYASWSLSEGACILTGVGFNGYDPKTGRTLWNRVRNVSIISIETAESYKVLFDSWNCRTNVWLRDCMYKRLLKKGKKPGIIQTMATFVTSAVWHGVQPGYYLAFITAGFFTSVGRQLRHFVRPYFLPTSPSTTPNSMPKWPYPNLAKRAYDVVGWFIVQTTLNYAAGAFMLLTFRDCITMWHRLGWYAHILTFGAMAFFQFGGRRYLRKGLPSKPNANGKPKREDVPSLKLSPPSPSQDERDAKDLRWVKHALDNPGYQDSGEGVNPVGLVDRVIQNAETPRSGSPQPRDL